MSRIHYVRCGNSSPNLRRPANERVACARHLRRDNLRRVILFICYAPFAAVRVKRHRVPVNLPLRHVGGTARRNCGGNCWRPTSECVTLATNHRCRKRCAIVLHNRLPPRASVRIKHHCVLAHLPVRIIYDIIRNLGLRRNRITTIRRSKPPVEVITISLRLRKVTDRRTLSNLSFAFRNLTSIRIKRHGTKFARRRPYNIVKPCTVVVRSVGPILNVCPAKRVSSASSYSIRRVCPVNHAATESQRLLAINTESKIIVLVCPNLVLARNLPPERYLHLSVYLHLDV